MPSISTPDNNPPSQGGPRELRILTAPSHKASTTSKSPAPPSPPPTPCPWLWRCHSCHTIYRLAVTRRCLDCDHTFCLGDSTGTTTALKSGKKRKRGGPCKAEFDYTGWKSRGAWRRTILLNGNNATKKGEGRGWGDEHEAAAANELGEETTIRWFDDKREHLFIRKQHNCFLHCDFPSECHHTLFRAQQAGRPILREALALDAAREAVAELDGTGGGGGNSSNKKISRRLTAQEVEEYKQELKRYRRGAAAARFPSPGDLLLLPPVDEADEEDNVSPCSPTSPDPPGDLMREVHQVSPIESGDEEQQLLPPVSPGGTQRRRSLLVATDTPADFATTAAPLCFDDDGDTYSDEDEGGDGDDESDKRRTKSRRKIAQLTGEEFGPFVFDTSSPSPTSPSGIITSVTRAATNNNNPAAALDLQAAYSEQAWFSNSSSSTHFHPNTVTTISAGPISPKSPERTGKRDRMLALLGRRAGGPPSPTRLSTREVDVCIDNVPAWRHHQAMPRENQPQQHHESEMGGEWEDWSDSSSSSASTVSGPDTDADGDVAMRDAVGAADDSSPSPPAKGVDEGMDEDSSPTPPGRQHGGGARGGEADEDLRVLLRMRNAFMRGEMR